jgi:hypothetical protein
MKEVIAVRTRVVPKPSVSAQIWKDIAKVISHSKTEVTSGVLNLVAESRTQEKTTCASTTGSSTDDLSMPSLWFSELGHSHRGKQVLLESYFKWQSSRTTSSRIFWIDALCIDRDSMKDVYHLLLENGQIHPNPSTVVWSIKGGVSWQLNAVEPDSMDPDIDESYKINKGLRVSRKLFVDLTSASSPLAPLVREQTVPS